MFGLAFFFVAGTLIVIASLALEPILAALQDRWGYQQHAYLEWVSQETLQLQRLAHEELGFGTWSGATDSIPTTKPGDKLACLDLSDPKHPRLQASALDLEKGADDSNVEATDVEAVSLSTQDVDTASCRDHRDSEAGIRDDATTDTPTTIPEAVESGEPEMAPAEVRETPEQSVKLPSVEAMQTATP